MKLLIVYGPLLLISCRPFTSHESSAEQIDATAVRHAEHMDRQTAIDSLAAGRRRWQHAGIAEYRLQTDYRCFCYHSSRVDIEDDWIEITVDSCAVIGATAKCDRRRSR